jgi:hypothetical protein
MSGEIVMIERPFQPGTVIEDSGTAGRDELACPACKRVDTTLKASAVARANRGSFVLDDGTLAAYQSELGAVLSRPPKPETLSGGIILAAFVAGWLLLGMDIGIIALLQNQKSLAVPSAALETAAYLGVFWFGLLIPGAAIVRYQLRRVRVNRELPEWHEDVRRWSSFHYCSRDDLVYVPGEGRGVDPDRIRLLYQRTSAAPVIALRPAEART